MTVFLVYDIIYKNNRFRPAVLGSQCINVIVLVLIVYMLTGITRDCITEAKLCTKEALPMKTKMKKVFVTIVSSVLNSVWTVGANLLAGALLT